MPDVIINGPEGRIEARYHHARGGTAPMAVVLHPHPLHGGTMNNKVVYALYQTFVRRGFSTLRFNFRGVGRSQGSFDRGEGELADAAAALDWLQGYRDTVVPADAVHKLVHKLSHQRDIKIDFRKIPGADHFFVDCAETLSGHVDAYIAAHAQFAAQAETAALSGRGR